MFGRSAAGRNFAARNTRDKASQSTRLIGSSCYQETRKYIDGHFTVGVDAAAMSRGSNLSISRQFFASQTAPAVQLARVLSPGSPGNRVKYPPGPGRKWARALPKQAGQE